MEVTRTAERPVQSSKPLNAGVVKAHELAYSGAFVLALIVTAITAWLRFSGGEGDLPWAIGLVFLPFMALHWWIARGAKRGKSWARYLSWLTGAVLCIGFPIGTMFGAYILYHLFKDEWQSEQ